jgi:periplasmic divalent cation tolerance protein
MSLSLITTACANQEDALALARKLLEAQLAACVQIIPGATSIYRWQGRIETSNECLLWVKTSNECAEAAMNFIRREHSYEIPEIVCFEAQAVDEQYAQWAQDVTLATD